MKTYILKEGVLNDDILITPSDGKIFKGNYIGIIKYYTYANSWTNKEHIKRFRSKSVLDKFLQKNYPEFQTI